MLNFKGERIHSKVKDRMNGKLKGNIDPEIEIKPGDENLRCCKCGGAFGFRDNRGHPIRHRVVKKGKLKIHTCDRCLVLAHIAAERKSKKFAVKKGYIDARRGT